MTTLAFSCLPSSSVSRVTRWGTNERNPGPQSTAGAGKGSVLWSQSLHFQATASGEKRKWHSYLLGLGCAYGQPETHNVDCLLGGLAQAQGVGRARDVVRGQDGHDDGST